MSDYEKELHVFLDAWDRVQRDIQSEDRLEQLAAQIGKSPDDLRRELDHVAATLRRIGSALTRKDLVEHAIETHGRKDLRGQDTQNDPTPN